MSDDAIDSWAEQFVAEAKKNPALKMMDDEILKTIGESAARWQRAKARGKNQSKEIEEARSKRPDPAEHQLITQAKEKNAKNLKKQIKRSIERAEESLDSDINYALDELENMREGGDTNVSNEDFETAIRDLIRQHNPSARVSDVSKAGIGERQRKRGTEQ